MLVLLVVLVLFYTAFSLTMLLRITWGEMKHTGLGEHDHNYAAGVFFVFPHGNWIEVFAPIWIFFGFAFIAVMVDLWISFGMTSSENAGRYAIPKALANVLPVIGVLATAVLITRHLDYFDGSPVRISPV